MVEGMKVSVIIVTKDRHKDLKECIESIRRSSYEPYELLVVDASEESYSLSWHKVCYFHMPSMDKQTARNLAIRHSSGDVLVFFDDDVIVSDYYFTTILKHYADSRVGGVCGRVLLPANRTNGVFQEYLQMYERLIGRLARGLVFANFFIDINHSIEVDFLYGCNMSFRKDALLKVGALDTKYLGNAFRDDTDVSLRVKRLGYKLVYEPKATVYHKFKGGKLIDNTALYFFSRNNTYFYFKNRLFPRLPIFIPLTFVSPFCIERGSRLSTKLRLNMHSIKAIVKGSIDGYLLSMR